MPMPVEYTGRHRLHPQSGRDGKASGDGRKPLQVWDMSKHDKDLVETESAEDLATESAVATDDALEALPLAAVQPEQNSSQAEQSRQFNSWLDRALPRLMDYLSNGTTVAVTSSGSKAKH
jgi:hypothetical protein